MKSKLLNLGTAFSRDAQKKLVGGLIADNCGSSAKGGCCNVYCGTGTGVTCSGSCGTCGIAGNGAGNKPGQDKLCQ